VRLLATAILLSSLAAGLCLGPAAAHAQSIAAGQHPWGRFQPGAWKTVCMVTETLDADGLVSGTVKTETRTTLMEVDDESVTLKVEVTIEQAGIRLNAETQTVRQGLHGGLLSDGLTVSQLDPAEVTVEGRAIDCNVLQLELAGPTNKTVTTVYHSGTVEPHILKRESVTTDPQGERTLSRSATNVVALNMPCRVLAETKASAILRTIRKHPKGTVTTWAFTSREVPGGIVSHSSKEVDSDGRVVRRSLLQLTGYDLEPDGDRAGLFGRKRPILGRKPGTPPRLFPH